MCSGACDHQWESHASEENFFYVREDLKLSHMAIWLQYHAIPVAWRVVCFPWNTTYNIGKHVRMDGCCLVVLQQQAVTATRQSRSDQHTLSWGRCSSESSRSSGSLWKRSVFHIWKSLLFPVLPAAWQHFLHHFVIILLFFLIYIYICIYIIHNITIII